MSGKRIDGWEREVRRLRFIKRIFFLSMLALVVVTGAVLWLIFTYSPTVPERSRPDIWSWEQTMKIQEAGGRALGRHVRERHPQAKVLVLVPPAGRKEDIEAITLEGLMAELEEHQGKISVQETALLREDALADAYLWFDAEAFDLAIASHSETEVVISLMGLPLHPQRMQFWQMRPRPELFLINAEIFRLAPLIEGGGITGVAARNPRHVFTRQNLTLPEAEELWIIITGENIRQLHLKHPNLFVPAGDFVREPVMPIQLDDD